MPKFFFHLRINGDYELDVEGVEISEADAIPLATAIATKKIVELIDTREVPPGTAYVIANENCEITLTVPFCLVLSEMGYLK